jgi:hypothetical protein
MSVIEEDLDGFHNEELLHMARDTVKSQKPFLEDIARICPHLQKLYPTKADFLKQRRIWEKHVFIPLVEDDQERQRLHEAWQRQRTQYNEHLKKDQALLKPFKDRFDNIAYHIYKPTGNKRARSDPAEEKEIYDSPRELTEIGIGLLKQYFPDCKTVVECCAGNGEMVNVLTEHGYNVISYDKYTPISSVPGFDVYKDNITEDFDVIFTNPPFKDKADFLAAMLKYYERGKGFCILLPFESDSQADFLRVKEQFPDKAIEKVTMDYTVHFQKDGKKVKPVGKLAWFVGGSMFTLPERKGTLTYSLSKGEKP